MDYDQLFSNARWEIIRAISHGKSSATELAKATKSSLPNISQQLKLLEAYDLVEYIKDQKKGAGKPRQIYQLKRELCYLTYARHGMAEKRLFNPDAYHIMLLNILYLPNLQDHPFIIKHFSTNEEVPQHCAVAWLKSNDNEIEVLQITDNIELIRAKYSNTFVEHAGKTRKIIAWTHTMKELQEGLARKEPYFENLLHNPIAIHDPKNLIDKVRKK
jgi:DNA-binding HxlR family transcriptional regulator